MYHLIKKDFLIQKRQVMLTLLLLVFFSFSLSPMGAAGLSVSILAITYMLVFGAGQLEDKNNGDVMLISLPIRRHTIVLSKYVSVYVFAAYALLVNLVIHAVADLFLSRHSTDRSYFARASDGYVSIRCGNTRDGSCNADITGDLFLGVTDLLPEQGTLSADQVVFIWQTNKPRHLHAQRFFYVCENCAMAKDVHAKAAFGCFLCNRIHGRM